MVKFFWVKCSCGKSHMEEAQTEEDARERVKTHHDVTFDVNSPTRATYFEYPYAAEKK